jgi:hypothetical protein
MKLRLKNISNVENKSKGNNYFISEEVNDSIGNNYKSNIQIQVSPNSKKISDEDINSILAGDYNQISDADYRELLDKKDQYLDSNMRLDKNIDNLRKTKNKKIAYILKIIKENDNNLQSIKKQNYLIEKEINDSIGVNYKSNIQMSPNNKKISDEDINSILTGDYNQISDADYRELLDKKDQYLDSNMRLDKNIDNLRKTKNKKIAYILKIIKENDNNLQNIKKQNYLIEREINKLNNIYQLTYEQVKLENEVNKKQINSKKKLKSDSIKKEEIDTNKEKDKSKEKEKENILIKSLDKNKDNNTAEEEIFPKKLKIKNTEKKSSKKRKKSGTREEKLRIIKEKYKDGNFELNDENSLLYDTEENNNNNDNKIINDELNIINDNKEVVSE